jgi:ubiquinone/menaquinone biosynthesis C-methylase UbiE
MTATDCAATSNCCDFAGSYDLSRLPEIKKLEQAALGCDYGGTSWTTRQQVSGILESLQLGSADRLLDIGSGAGWPGLLLSKESNCGVTLLDIPLNALSQAAERAIKDGMTENVNIVSASGTLMPFADESFDCVSHSDVLCCLPEKLQLLKESRRVSRRGARMHFSVILPAEGLFGSELDEVLETGPPFVGLDGTYREMLVDAGWQEVERQDVTVEYKNSLQRLVDGIYTHAAELTELLGAVDLVSRREHREDQIALIERGLMRREAVTAIAS